MRFQEGSQRSALPYSSSWEVEGECRPRAYLRSCTKRPFKSFSLSSCLPHNLLIAKLNAYGFDNKAVRFVYDYLTSRKQRTKISDVYSSWKEILSGVPQGSMLRPLLSNIDICNLFFIIKNCDIANYADDNTPYLKWEKCWGSFERFRECVANGLLKTNWKELQANVIYW